MRLRVFPLSGLFLELLDQDSSNHSGDFECLYTVRYVNVGISLYGGIDALTLP